MHRLATLSVLSFLLLVACASAAPPAAETPSADTTPTQGLKASYAKPDGWVEVNMQPGRFTLLHPASQAVITVRLAYLAGELSGSTPTQLAEIIRDQTTADTKTAVETRKDGSASFVCKVAKDDTVIAAQLILRRCAAKDPNFICICVGSQRDDGSASGPAMPDLESTCASVTLE